MPDGTATIEASVTGTDTGTTATPAAGTPAPEQGATGGTPQAASPESFTDVDPQTLPPELQGRYKSMLADYTRKTQAIAEIRKKADYYDQLARDQRVVEFVQGLSKRQKAEFKEQKAEVEKKLGEKISDEEFAKGFQSKDDFLSLIERVVQERSVKDQKKIEQLEQKVTVADAGDVVESFATQVDPMTGAPVRPDFYALDEDQLITGYLTINQPEEASEMAYLNKLNEAYTWPKAVTQKYYEKGRTDALKRIEQKAAGPTEPRTSAAKGAYTGPDPKKLSVREAMDLAKKG